jgi:hypothetical protein
MTRTGSEKHESSLTLKAAIALVAALVWFRNLPAPFVGPTLAAGVFCLLEARDRQGQVARVVLVNLGVIFLTLGGIESYYWLHSPAHTPPKRIGPPGYIVRDEALGYAPAQRAVAPVRMFHDDSVLYDVVYTIDSTGLRISQPPSPHHAKACALFFGDSFTFGEGVQDTESMPYRVSLRTAGRFHVYNFGFHGYGPHQMLAALETGRVNRVLDCAPRYAIYLALADDIDRAAGLASWDTHGPRYRLRSDGTPQLDGHFDDPDSAGSWSTYLRYEIRKSALVTALQHLRIGPNELRLFLAIVTYSARRIEHMFPDCEFHVLVWPTALGQRGGLHARLIGGLRARGLRVHDVSEVLPTFLDHPEQYQLSRYDHHPNARALDSVAAYVVSTILEPPSVGKVRSRTEPCRRQSCLHQQTAHP